MRDLRFEELGHVYGGGGQSNCGGTKHGGTNHGTNHAKSKPPNGTPPGQEKKENPCN